MNQVVLDAPFLEQLEQAHAADPAGEGAAGNVAGAVLAAIGAEPAGDRVDIDAVGDEDFLGHGLSFSEQARCVPARWGSDELGDSDADAVRGAARGAGAHSSRRLPGRSW